MTIEEWNTVLSAAILVLLTGGGIWLKYVVEQQLKSKDTAIQALEGVITLKDAHIASLESNTAPAIVRAYADMRQHANQVTEDSQRLAAQLAEAQQHKAEATHTSQSTVLIAEGKALSGAFDLIREHIGQVLFPDGENINPLFDDRASFEALYDSYLLVLQHLNVQTRNRITTAEKSLLG
jgi:hypothetical protein